MSLVRGVAQTGVARLHGVQEVGGSNPLAPTKKHQIWCDKSSQSTICGDLLF